MPDGILVVNSEGIIADINPAALRIISRQKINPLGKRLATLWPQLDLISGRLKQGTHTELACETGSKRHCLDISITDLMEKKGNLAGRLIVMRDITERRLMEQTLRESESRYSALVEQSNEGVLIIQDRQYKFANRTLSEITGYQVDEITGTQMPFGVIEEDRQIAEKGYRERLSGRTGLKVYELRVRRKDGREIDAELTAGTIIFEGQSAQLVTVRDITERKKTQSKLEQLYNQEIRLRNSLQEEIDKRSRYTRALVHELKTPLTAILASGEILEMEIKDRIQAALVKNIRRASFNLEQRINELIELARGEVGMLKINAVPMDLGELAREVVSEMKPVARAKGLDMELIVDEGPRVLGDSNRLKQVLNNLIGNSLKYTLSGKIEIRIKPSGEDFMMVEVQDTGTGITPEVMKHLFDPYLRKVNEGKDSGGLGIGLLLSKMFIDLHGGKIWAESGSSGSTFKFTVPVFKQEYL